MPLYEPVPKNNQDDPGFHRQLEFNSSADGSLRYADVHAPSRPGRDKLPLVLAPHPIDWTSENDYYGGLPGLKRGHHKGWLGLAEKYSIIIVQPHGHHRRLPGCSLAAPEQIDDMIQLINEIQEVGYHVNHKQIYACGLSMGGQESLVAAGKYPQIFAGVVVFNPIVDLLAWQEDLARSESQDIRDYGTDRRIVVEVGVEPDKMPLLYNERSATNYVEGLMDVPILMFWSEKDFIVPRQQSCHAYRIYQMIKTKSYLSPVAEYNHTLIHGITEYNNDIRWQLHEWCDYELALNWLLHHYRVG